MKLSLFDQSSTLANRIPSFKTQPLSFVDYTRFPEKRDEYLIPTNQPVTDLRTCHVDFLFSYTIFPSNLMAYAAEWESTGRMMKVGDVIVQQAFLPPWPLFMKCIFAVKILSLFNTPERRGFQYGTLVGHVEKGVSEFAFILRQDKLYAQIHTFSKPGQLMSQLVAPFFTLPYQRYCTKKAIAHMADQFIRTNSSIAKRPI